MTNKSPSRSAGLPHAVFLQRVADEPAISPDVRLGQGAFLTLRFVDLLAPDRELPTPEVFRYQWAATERYCAELAGEGTEAAHLSGIVRATGEAHASGDVRLIAPSLFAYALYLEQESHFEEAEDALLTMIAVGEGRVAVADNTSAWMRLGRVRRKQSDFDGALAAYTEAGRIAQAAGDTRAMLLSRVGICNVHFFRGNLPEAERGWRGLLAETATGQQQAVEAQAHHGLGNLLQRRGLAHAGAPHLWRAYELYEDESDQLRVLNDLGIALLAIGDVEGAERALREVARRDQPGENRTNSYIELMQCASFRRDRLSFERWRERALSDGSHLPTNLRADYHVKAGIGFARFGSMRRAEAELRHGYEIAVAHNINELAFRAERILSGLDACGAPEYTESAAATVMQDESLREVSASLAALGD